MRSKRLQTAFGIGLSAWVIVGPLGTQAEAFATKGGCFHFDPANDDDGLGIGVSSTDYNASLWSSTVDAAARWNGRVTPNFTLVPYGSSTRDVKVNFKNLGVGNPSIGGTAAETTTTCDSKSGHYTSDPDTKWNRQYDFSSYGSSLQSAVGVHELGHAYGLAHWNTQNCLVNQANQVGMMHEGVWAYFYCTGTARYNPTVDDVNGQTVVHPA